ncbi:uncharacterized protein LOC144146869 isoform X2 [Haemaphysalis longicornis]
MTLSFAILACLVLAAKADAKVCGDLTGVQCRASAVFDLFRSGYLLATTGKAPKYAAPPYIKRVSGFGPGYVRLFFQTDSYQETCAIRLTGRLDNFVVSCRSDPSTLHTLRVPFADYKNCYVVQHGKYNSDFTQCRILQRPSNAIGKPQNRNTPFSALLNR